MRVEEFQARVRRFIEYHRLLQPGMRVVVGVSGGADSVALLHVLKELTPLSLSLHVAHLNHLLRPEAGEEAGFVQKLAHDWGIPVTIGYAPVRRLAVRLKTGVEEAGRVARYRFFRQVARLWGADRIAVAHQADDRVETILLNLLRGSGTSGLTGIPVRTGRVVRPLLGVNRAAIQEYCRQVGIEWCTDPSNLSSDYLRNRIRHELLPLLEREFNPRVREALLRLGEILEGEDEFLRDYVRQLAGHLRLPGTAPGEVRLALSGFRSLPLALQRRLVRLAVAAVAGEARDLGYLHVEDCLALLREGPVGGEVHLPGGIRLRKGYGDFAVGRLPDGGATPPQVLQRIAVPGETRIPALGVVVQAELFHRPSGLPPLTGSSHRAFFDYDQVQLPLYVRIRRPGDRIRPFGMEGSKKLKKLFSDLKIPREERDRVPLVVSDTVIYWVVGYRRSREAAVTPATQRVLMLHFIKMPSAIKN